MEGCVYHLCCYGLLRTRSERNMYNLTNWILNEVGIESHPGYKKPIVRSTPFNF